MREEKSAFFLKAAILFLALFMTSTAFQIWSGAWRSDFGGHADEAAHVVTSLMVRDYLAGGFLETPHPIRFAENYYERFPKVALGHYPPGFYLGAAIPLLISRSGIAILCYMNLIGAATGLAVWATGRRLLGSDLLAGAVAFLYLVLPQTRTYTAIVMADLLLVLFSLLAALSFARFMEKGRGADSLWFGIWSAAAILTKGSGIGLALLPVMALILARKWKWFGNPRLWLAPLPVLVLAMPWLLLTMGITGEGMQKSRIGDWLAGALPFYGQAGVGELGWIALAALAASAVAFALSRLKQNTDPGPMELVAWALLASGLCVPLLVPAGLDSRYLMPVIPPALLLAILWMKRISSMKNATFGCFAAAGLIVVIAVETWRPVRKWYTGASEVVEVISSDAAKSDSLSSSRVLVISNAGGEGAVIAAANLNDPQTLRMDRGSKLLASSDWMGRDYETAFDDREGFMGILIKNRIRYVVIDPPAPETDFEHWRKAADWLSTADGRIEDLGSFLSERRDKKSQFRVYRIDS